MNVLITADIHFGEYNDYNFEPGFRLKQFDLLADRYIEMAKEYNCEELWIAGDLLKIPNNRCRQIHEFKNFIAKLVSGFKTVRYILGQHDLDSKSDDQSLEDSIVNLFDYDNFIFSDKQILDFNGNKIAFASWTQSQDISWIKDKVDILIGHYTKSTLFGQEIDESKFDLMIHGDIHNDQVIGKFVSIGNPIQHDLNSQAKGTCVLLNTDTKEWKHVETDEDHSRFLRIQYTDEQSLEGFVNKLTYNIYKPKNVSTSNDVSVPKWKEISELITKVIDSEGLSDIHAEVIAKCKELEEMDFNFQLKYVDITGFRSIKHVRLEFDQNERLVLIGRNGTGKSSIIKAIKSVFEKSCYMMDEKSDFSDTILVTVGMFYQNKLYEITKGDSYSLKIDGVEMQYNNKTQFENDVPEKLPFFKLTDLFFITSDVQNLSSQFTPDRRIELIGQFYRLRRLDSYSATAYSLRDDTNNDIVPLDAKLHELIGSIDSINTRIEELKDTESYDVDDLNNQLNKLHEMRDKFEAKRKWDYEVDKVKSNMSQVQSQISSYKDRMVINIDMSISDRDKAKSEYTRLTDARKNLSDRWSIIREVAPAMDVVTKKGVELKNKKISIENGVCPTCGSKIKSDESVRLINSLEIELKELRDSYMDLKKKLDGFTEEEINDKDYFKNKVKDCDNLIEQKNIEMNLLTNKICEYNIAKDGMAEAESSLSKLQSKLDELNNNKPESIQLPEDLTNKEYDLVSKITKCKDYKSEQVKLIEKTKELDEVKSQIETLKTRVTTLVRYAELTSNTGSIYEEILKKLAEGFTSPDIEYGVQSWVSRGKRHLSFNSYFKVKGTYRLYEKLSDGQKTVCDLDFLSKLFSVRMGLLVLDEHLKHLDEDNLPKASVILSKMNVNTIILSTHDNNFSGYTKRLILELNKNGETEIEVK
jgi:energy-coupling factor transporter ATP-binding protein EcfA2